MGQCNSADAGQAAERYRVGDPLFYGELADYRDRFALPQSVGARPQARRAARVRALRASREAGGCGAGVGVVFG